MPNILLVDKEHFDALLGTIPRYAHGNDYSFSLISFVIAASSASGVASREPGR